MMTPIIRSRARLTAGLAAFAVVAASCAPRRPAAPTPQPVPEAPAPVTLVRAAIPYTNPNIPPVPHVTGPLEIKVVYPKEGQLIQSKDSNFIFGSVGNGDAALTINGVPTPVWPNGSFMGWLPNPAPELPRYDLVATTGADTVRLSHPVKIQPPPAVTPPGTPPPPPADTVDIVFPARYATLIPPPAVSNDTDRVVRAYELKADDPKWLLLPGTRVTVTGLGKEWAYVEFDGWQGGRIRRTELTMLPTTATPVARRVGPLRLVPAQGWTDIVIPATERPPFLVEEGPKSITLTLYTTSGKAQPPINLPPSGGNYVSSVSSSTAGTNMRFTISLNGPVFGYEPLWQDSLFVFRVRQPPPIDATDPLRGLTIAIDPGHPPLGATGPTGLYEGDAVLAVGLRVQTMLQARGVNVLMTRTTSAPVALDDRPTMARRANAHALVSIHLNALPDGQNPYREHGTTTFYFHPHALPLAQEAHKALLAELSLPDKGVKRGSLVLTRPTWMPAILCEGAFIMMPDEEAAVRQAEYQERYARGIVAGLDGYFRSLGQATH